MANHIRHCYTCPEVWEELEGGGVFTGQPVRYELSAHHPGALDRIWACSERCAKQVINALEFGPSPAKKLAMETGTGTELSS